MAPPISRCDIVRGGETESYGSFFGQDHSVEDLLQLDSLGESAGLYVKGKGKATNPSAQRTGPVPSITLEDILWSFQHDLIDIIRLKFLIEYEPAFSFLKVLVAVSEIYREPTAGGATISFSIVEKMFDPPIFSKSLGKDDRITAP